MVYEHDSSYSLPKCDICWGKIEAEERRETVRAEFEISNSYPDFPSSVGERHVGHYCPDCHDFEELEPSTIDKVRYHYANGDLLMVEIERTDARVRWKLRPNDTPDQIVELGEEIASEFPSY